MIVKTLLDRPKLDHAAPGTLHLMVSVTAPEIEEADRPPMTAVLVIDISGSMSSAATMEVPSPTKMELTKKAVIAFVDQLLPTDRIGIVAFDDCVQTVAPLGELTDAHRAEIHKAVEKLFPRNDTDLVAGAVAGRNLMATVPPVAGETRRIVLFTDGEASTGIQNPPEIITAIKGTPNDQTPITTMGFGAGGGYNAELLQSIASETGGNSYHAEGSEGIIEAFALELGALRSVALTDLEITIIPLEFPLTGVASGFPVEYENGKSIVRIAQLMSGETQHVIARFEPAPSGTPSVRVVADVQVRGIEKNGSDFTHERQNVNYVGKGEADTTRNPLVEEQRLRFTAAVAIRKANEMAKQGDHIGAAKLVAQVREQCIALGTDLTKELAANLAALEKDIGDAKSFAFAKGTIQTTVTGIGTGRASGSPYTDRSFTKPIQRQTMSFMKGVDAAAPEPEAAEPIPSGGQTMTIFAKEAEAE